MRVPWRIRIATAVLRGFLRDPAQALRSVGSVNIEMGSVYRFKLHIHGKDMLRDFMEAAAEAGVRPFLTWGTLLGFMRQGGFLPHDYDIDTAILADDYPRKDALKMAMIARGYRVRHDVPFAFSFETRDRLLHLDVDVLYPFKDDLVSSMVSETTGRISAHRFPSQAYRSLERRMFPGQIPVWVPKDPERALEAMYGDWRVPVKDYSYRTGPRNTIPDPEKLGIGHALPPHRKEENAE